jgi:putative sugar O-methyltransferase
MYLPQMIRRIFKKLGFTRAKLNTDRLKLRRISNAAKILRAAKLLSKDRQAVLFITSLLRAREINLATSLRRIGWKVVLVYIETTPFKPGDHFDEVILAKTESEAHMYAKLLSPNVCHVFSGAVDGLLYRLCADKPGPVVVDMNDIFCEALFDYCHERFEPTRDCLERADGLCARDLQAKSAERLNGYRLPQNTLFFPEYPSQDNARPARTTPKLNAEEVHVVSVGTFCLESQGMYDSGYLRLAEMFAEQGIHFHIYPHWFYRVSEGSVFNWNLQKDFVDFFRLQEKTPYLHIHESLPLEELAQELPQYDFGIVSGGSVALGQNLKLLKPEYMRTCYSGRIADYLNARLPVLVNPEVAFDFWLLKHYGVVVDLNRLLKPGFREELLASKKDRARIAAMERAVKKFSIEENVHRLADFYTRIMDNTSTDWIRLSYPWSVAKGLPVVGKTFRQLDAEIQHANRAVSSQKTLIQNNRQEIASLQRQLASLQRQLYLQPPDLDLQPPDPDLQSTGNDPTGAATHTGPDAQGILQHRPRRNMLNAKRSLLVERGAQWADELHGLLNWPEIRDPAELTTGMPELLEIVRLFSTGTGTLSELSSCWQVLGFKNFNQLLRDGYRNFKRTIGCSYFNFLVQQGDPQIATLESLLGPVESNNCRRQADLLPDDPTFEWHDQKTYRYFVLLLWTFARKMDTQGYLNQLEEPAEGNPLIVPAGQQRASQDLANSLLEYYAMAEAVDFGKCHRILEIGGGYGRDAYVITSLNPDIQYTLVDIPPALWIAQRYMMSVFPDRKIFRVRNFQSYEEVREEIEGAAIVCLLPHQLDLLPDAHFDLSLNISSFGEMEAEQIGTYLSQLERVTMGHFYMKQWKVSQNAFDHLSLTEDSYPVSPKWKKVYSRTCPVQNAFFESLYRTHQKA